MANIIFDFDGTIADSLPATIAIFEELLRGGKPMTPEEVERLRGMSLLRVGAELRIVPWKAPLLLARGRSRMRRRMKTIPIFPGIAETIRQLRADGHTLYVVSSNSTQNIRIFLKQHKLDTEFVRLYGSAGIFGKTKLLRTMLRRTRVDHTNTYYIGDEVRDIEAAKKNSIKVIAVTWGYNNAAILHDHSPDVMAASPAEILNALQDAKS